MSTTLAPQLVADALGIEPGAVDQSTAPGVTPEWNSLAHIRLIVSLEEHIGRVLGPEEIVSIASLVEVEALLQER